MLLFYGGLQHCTVHFLLIICTWCLCCETDLYFAIFEHKEWKSTIFFCYFLSCWLTTHIRTRCTIERNLGTGHFIFVYRDSWWTYQTGVDWQNTEPCYVSFHSAKGGRVWKIRENSPTSLFGVSKYNGRRRDWTCTEILEKSMGAMNRVGIGLSYRPARLHRLPEPIPGLLKV